MNAIQIQPDLCLVEPVRLSALGDRQAYARLVDTYRGSVCAIALSIVGDVDASEDIAQEVFLGAWRGLGTLRNPHSFLPWLRQTTRNLARQFLRSRGRRRRRVPEQDAALLLQAAADPNPDACACLITQEERTLVANTIAALPEESREVVALYYREGQSAAQVAALLDLSEEAVKKRLSRARAAIRAAVLDDVGAVLGRTAPGAAFTAAVLAALPLSAPATAGAAGLTAAAGKSGLAKLLMLSSGLVLGAAGGVVGVLLGAQMAERNLRYDDERQALRRFRWQAVALVLAGVSLFPLLLSLSHSRLVPLLWWLSYASPMTYLLAVRLPRLAARSLADLRRDNPRSYRWQRLVAWLVLGNGLVMGTAMVIKVTFFRS